MEECGVAHGIGRHSRILCMHRQCVNVSHTHVDALGMHDDALASHAGAHDVIRIPYIAARRRVF